MGVLNTPGTLQPAVARGAQRRHHRDRAVRVDGDGGAGPGARDQPCGRRRPGRRGAGAPVPGPAGASRLPRLAAARSRASGRAPHRPAHGAGALRLDRLPGQHPARAAVRELSPSALQPLRAAAVELPRGLFAPVATATTPGFAVHVAEDGRASKRRFAVARADALHGDRRRRRWRRSACYLRGAVPARAFDWSATRDTSMALVGFAAGNGQRGSSRHGAGVLRDRRDAPVRWRSWWSVAYVASALVLRDRSARRARVRGRDCVGGAVRRLAAALRRRLGSFGMRALARMRRVLAASAVARRRLGGVARRALEQAARSRATTSCCGSRRRRRRAVRRGASALGCPDCLRAGAPPPKRVKRRAILAKRREASLPLATALPSRPASTRASSCPAKRGDPRRIRSGA